jgi:anti-sigma factor RsiW
VNCNEFVELVTAFLDGALDAESQARVVEHLAACDGCDRYLDQMRRTIRALGDPAPERLPQETRDALLAAFRRMSD